MAFLTLLLTCKRWPAFRSKVGPDQKLAQQKGLSVMGAGRTWRILDKAMVRFLLAVLVAVER